MGWRDATLTIASGESESEELDLAENNARRIANILFHALATLGHKIPLVTRGPFVQIARSSLTSFKAMMCNYQARPAPSCNPIAVSGSWWLSQLNDATPNDPML